ncbi:hypothetical protein SAMD00019534_074520 [Acytostelium subglobosum LB1]|uniref:hypothetical protein n=1 Tax=Acytostelium subglobosum LB1 TaxID=1410327 RepID=UPI000644D485|nr:hypothetical protein SAMD00019534_074520 [Acytostelium subglobosum LB1]GAM24277.1 hypothetical protein SAMD00019534_074520 [Acytostelium subglobosum LB1]|eukprot:XP_012752603.1 hypothetical protein SAMD00019534_074520 [Acytostelium subglobosum LB1]
MKCLIILDPENSECLYVEHKNDSIIAPQFQTIINFIKQTIGQRPQFINAGKIKIVFQYNDNIHISLKSSPKVELLWFVLVSDDDDSESLLRARLNLLNNLYSMVLGNTLIDRRNKKQVDMRALRRKMSQISATVNAIFDESQSVLCQAYETLDLNEKIRQRCIKDITDLMELFPKAVYAIVYVGQKLVTFHCKKKPHLQNMDLFLLSLYAQIQLKPRERFVFKMEEREVSTPLSIANEISQFENVSPRNDHGSVDSISSPIQIGEDGLSGEDDFETAPEDFDENTISLAKSIISLLDDIGGSSMNKSMKQKISSEFLKDGVKQSSSSDVVTLLNHFLLAVGFLDESAPKDLYTTMTEDAVKRFQRDNELSETGEADPQTTKQLVIKTPYLHRKKSQPPPPSIDLSQSFKDISLGGGKRPEDSHSSSSTSSSSTANNAKNNINNNNNNVEVDDYKLSKSTFEKIYIRNTTGTPLFAYCAEVQKNSFLILLNKEMHKEDEEKELAFLEKSKQILYDKLFKQLGGFLLTKELSNLVISRFNHIPGLVHFILIDRSYHRIKAPNITPLNGNKYQTANVNMKELIRKKVWSMYSYCYHQLVKKNFTYQILKDKDFQYSYKLWMDDDESQEVEREATSPTSEKIYLDSIKKYYPQPVKCMELLTLYVGMIPMSLIYKNDRVLWALLFDKESAE